MAILNKHTIYPMLADTFNRHSYLRMIVVVLMICIATNIFSQELSDSITYELKEKLRKANSQTVQFLNRVKYAK